jgi:hypothetical protein
MGDRDVLLFCIWVFAMLAAILIFVLATNDNNNKK